METKFYRYEVHFDFLGTPGMPKAGLLGPKKRIEKRDNLHGALDFIKAFLEQSHDVKNIQLHYIDKPIKENK